MSRTSDEDVAKILAYEADDISAYINIANQMVTSVTSGCGYAECYLKEMQRWLAAHFVAVGENSDIKSKKIDDAATVFSNAGAGDGLKTTRYGRQVLVMDTCGRFANLGKRAAKIEVALDVPDA